MPYLLRRILKTTALILVGAIAAGWPTGDDVAHARKCQQAAGHPVSLDRHRGRDRRQSGDRILRDSLMNWLATERGVHAETLLVSAGAIAGFAAQAAILERIKSRDVPGATKDMAGADLSRLLSEKGLAVLVTAKSGETYYFGDLINGYLVKQATTVNYHLFGILAAAIQDGVRYEELPDPRPMFRHASQTVGTPEFGILHPPQNLSPQLTPRQALDQFWPRTKFIFERMDGQGVVEPAKGKSVRPEYWPLIAALVARQFLLLSKDTIDPRVGVGLIMESAIVMSKVDPKTVPPGGPEGK
jgi:hypothetical protein